MGREIGRSSGGRGGERGLPGWMGRLFADHGAGLGVNRQPWFGRDILRFLDYAKLRGAEQLDFGILKAAYLESLRHAEPPMEEWKCEQARQTLDDLKGTIRARRQRGLPVVWSRTADVRMARHNSEIYGNTRLYGNREGR